MSFRSIILEASRTFCFGCYIMALRLPVKNSKNVKQIIWPAEKQKKHAIYCSRYKTMLCSHPSLH